MKPHTTDICPNIDHPASLVVVDPGPCRNRNFSNVRSTLYPLFASVIVLTATAHADDWPLARGDTVGAGVAHTTLSDHLEVLWKYSADKDAAFDATPVVANGVIYIGDSAGTFHAVRLADGKPVWTKQFADSGFSAAAAYDNKLIYVGDVNGVAYCLDSADGKKKWKQSLEGEVYAGPTPDGDNILFTCEAGTLTCLAKKDGKPKWSFRIEAPLRCTPTISGGHAMLAGCDSRLHLIDVTNGKEVASVPIDAPTGSTPAMHNQHVYFGTEGGTFFSIQVPASPNKKPSVVWRYHDPQRSQPIRSAAAVTDRLVVFGSQSKAIYFLDPKTGGELWKMPTTSRVESSPVIAGHRVVAATAAGKMYLFDADTHQVKWQYDTGGGFTGSPAVVDGRIIVGNTDGALYCFGSKKKEKN
ncbi:MAG TPA: PQQ-binding-like beta-propeller repeat protein [Lacipirellulaceae bacterium]|nr:PQQ-binding-like beta-propeller repeat protein [Lacipirellulaceae bacterium]